MLSLALDDLNWLHGSLLLFRLGGGWVGVEIENKAILAFNYPGGRWLGGGRNNQD